MNASATRASPVLCHLLFAQALIAVGRVAAIHWPVLGARQSSKVPQATVVFSAGVKT
jgi:hypothetical protein